MNAPMTSEDYLKELIQSKDSEFAALVIGFETVTRFLWRNSPDLALRLNDLMSSGGKPIAILGANVVGNAVVYSVEPFHQYADDPGVRRYLEAVGDQAMEALKRRWEAARN